MRNKDEPDDPQAGHDTLSIRSARMRASLPLWGAQVALVALLWRVSLAIYVAVGRGWRWLVPSWQAVLRWFQANTFSPNWLPQQWHHPSVGYVAAALLQMIATVLDLLLISLFPTFEFHDVLLTFVIVAVALTWGAGPSLAATLVGVVLLIYFVLSPRLTWVIDDVADGVGLALYSAIGVITSIIASQTQRAHRGTEQLARQLAATFASMMDAVLVYDRAGDLLQTNPAAFRVLGLDARPEAASVSLRERMAFLVLRDERGQVLAPEQSPPHRVLRGEILTGANAPDLLVYRQDGREVRLDVRGEPIFDGDGYLVGGVCIYRDVTERRRLEQRTRDALNALLAMAESLVQVPEVPAAAAETPAATETHAPSPANETVRHLAELMADTLGCPRVGVFAVEAGAQTLRPLIVTGLALEWEPPRWHEPLPMSLLEASPYAAFLDRLRAGEVLILDMTQPPLEQAPNPFGVRCALVAPMRVGDQLVGLLAEDYAGIEHTYSPDERALAGAVAQLGALVIERERLLREREEARTNALALREANRRMDEFLGIASHELKTPLTSIQGYIQLLSRRVNDPQLRVGDAESIARFVAMVRMVLERSEHSVHRINRLIDDLLDDSRIREGRLEFRLERCDLAAIVEEAVEDQRVFATSRTIRLELPTTRPVPVIGDANRIGQVVANYLTNALKYSREGQPVEVRLDVANEIARVAVRDEGVGIPEAAQAHIWERFYRVAGVDVQSGSEVGMGIGLHICQNIIAGHRGQVGMESAPGQGSTFWFTLPLARSTR